MNRNEFISVFKAYAGNYDLTDPKILLKYIHTEKVADNSERIARSLGLPEKDVELAWQIGVLHDIGRFEQLRRYDTFNDAESINHAEFGADLLFRENLIESFLERTTETLTKRMQSETGSTTEEIFEKRMQSETDRISDEANGNRADSSSYKRSAKACEVCSGMKEKLSLAEIAIRCHNRYRLPEGLTEREALFCNIIRDADKADIFRANYETGMAAIYNVTMKELKESEITPEVYSAFMEGHAVLRSLKKTPIDHLVGHLALAFEFVFPETGKITMEQGFLCKLSEFHSENEDTERKLEQIRYRLKQECVL